VSVLIEKIKSSAAGVYGTVRDKTASFIKTAIPIVKDKSAAAWSYINEFAAKVWDYICFFFRGLWRMLVHGFRMFIGKKVMRSAAEFSFNIMLTIFPLLICINWFVGRLHTSLDSMIDVLSQFLPSSAVEIISSYIQYISGYQSYTALFLGIFMMLMPASAALRALQGILNDIYNRQNKESLLSFMLSFLASILFLVAVYVCMILMVSGNWLLRFLVNQFDLDAYILDWNWLRFLLLFLLLDVLLYLLYRFLPFSIKSPRSVFVGRVYPGVLFSSIMLVVVSIIFSYFIGLSTRYSIVYGSLTSIVILMLWLYACSNVIIIGGIFNRLCDEAAYRKRARSRMD